MKKKGTKATKRAKKRGRPADLSAKAARAVKGGPVDVKGGAIDIFGKIGDIKGESFDDRSLGTRLR
jgi:hypothetical protein